MLQIQHIFCYISRLDPGIDDPGIDPQDLTPVFHRLSDIREIIISQIDNHYLLNNV